MDLNKQFPFPVTLTALKRPSIRMSMSSGIIDVASSSITLRFRSKTCQCAGVPVFISFIWGVKAQITTSKTIFEK